MADAKISKTNQVFFGALVKELLLIILLLLVFCVTNYSFAADSVIKVYYNREIGRVNKKIFGSSFLGYDYTLNYPDMNYHYYGYTDYGSGIWNPKQNKSVKEAIDLAKRAGLSIIRFPGGCGAHHYNWKNAIGENREHYLYGIDEFLESVKEIDAEPFFTVSYFTGNAQDASDLVEYLNAPGDGKHPWADKRARNGHPESYSVKYFEFGNEVWHGDHVKIKHVNPIKYAERYLIYREAMKKVDPSIQLGLLFYHNAWNRKVLETVGSEFDFLVRHDGPPHINGLDAEGLYEVGLGALIIDNEKNFRNNLKLVKRMTRRDDVYLAVTEYSRGFPAADLKHYRHSLGGSLIIAEFLKIFMKPEHKILFANNWHFSNGFAEMVRSESNFMKHDYRTPINYIKHPIYYVFELYNEHFGDILIDTVVNSSTYDLAEYKPYMKKRNKTIRDGTIINKNLLNEGWNIRNLSGIFTEEKDGILEIDFINSDHFNYVHSTKHVKILPDTYYRLSGKIRTDNLIDKNGGVSLSVVDGRGWQKTQSAVSTRKIAGTTGWQFVDVLYKTLPDAESVNVIARRIGKEGPLKGKAFFKDVRLDKYILPDTHIPYLSLNASKSKKLNSVYLMVINKNMDEDITSLIELNDFVPSGKADAWILNGPSIDASNEKISNNVKVTHKSFEIESASFEFTFEKHSLTAIEIR